MAARARRLALFLAAVMVACDSPATTSAALGGTDPARPEPSAIGRLTVRVDTGLAIVGRHLHVQVSATDATSAVTRRPGSKETIVGRHSTRSLAAPTLHESHR